MAIMKKIAILAMACLLMLTAGCKKDQPKDLTGLLLGEWELTGYEPVSKSITIGEETVSVSLFFFQDEKNGFVIMQSVGGGYIKQFSGTWTLTNNVLTGVYSDNTPWGASYNIDIVEENTLTMATSDNTEVYTYKRKG